MTLYKTTGLHGEPIHGGTGNWVLPTHDRPGHWRKAEGSLKTLQGGISLCEAIDLPRWLGPAIWEAEWRGVKLQKGDKITVSEARLVRRLPWSLKKSEDFAFDCLKHAGVETAPASLAFIEPHVFASNCAMFALRHVQDVEAERRWQRDCLMEYLRK